jgi:hypothetical protein
MLGDLSSQLKITSCRVWRPARCQARPRRWSAALANSVAFSAGPSLSPVKVASYFCSELSITAK